MQGNCCVCVHFVNKKKNVEYSIWQDWILKYMMILKLNFFISVVAFKSGLGKNSVNVVHSLLGLTRKK